MSLALYATSQPISRAALAVTSSQDQPPVLVKPPSIMSASRVEIHPLLVPVVDLVPALKVPSRKNEVNTSSPRELTSMPCRLSAELEPPVAAHWLEGLLPSLMKNRSAPPLLAVMDQPFLAIVPS